MDDRRFDTWARTVAGLGSRRRVLGGLVGVAGAALLGAFRRSATDVVAHHGRSGPGDPCRHDNPCLGADAPLVCAWNGFDYDGDLNCCTYEGNRCGFDEACCGMASCVGGFCSSANSPVLAAGVSRARMRRAGPFSSAISTAAAMSATRSASAIPRGVCGSTAATSPTSRTSLFPLTAGWPLPTPAAVPATSPVMATWSGNLPSRRWSWRSMSGHGPMHQFPVVSHMRLQRVHR